MSDIRVKWSRNPYAPKLPVQVQVVCTVCRKWANVGEPTTGNSIIVNPNKLKAHGCKWWTRLGPLTRLINRVRRTKRLPIPGGITYQIKEIT